jgi:hypothetical protein
MHLRRSDTGTLTDTYSQAHPHQTQTDKKVTSRLTHGYKITSTQTHTARHKQHNLPTITDHHTAQFLNTTSQLCDGIQCRQTARTAGSAKGEILDWELGKKQTDQVKIRKSVKRGQKNKLLTVSDTEQDTLLSSVGSFSSEQSTDGNCTEIKWTCWQLCCSLCKLIGRTGDNFKM